MPELKICPCAAEHIDCDFCYLAKPFLATEEEVCRSVFPLLQE